jgi:hypothetical protein
MPISAKQYLLASLALAALTLMLSACGGSSNASSALPVTTPTVTATLSTETFTGSIARNGSAVHPFVVTTGGYAVLAGYTGLSPASQTALGLGLGYWDGTTSTCGLNQLQNDAARSGSTAVSATAVAGNYCLRVYDGGNIVEGTTASYTLQVQHY